jgi:hypothetical protein
MGAEASLDGAVLDINLGGETSYPIADALAAREVPFVFTTGYDAHTLPERYGRVIRCEKPVRTTSICDAIGRLIHD